MAYALRNCGDMAQRLLKTMQEDGWWNDRMSWCLIHILYFESITGNNYLMLSCFLCELMYINLRSRC